jgi:ABC-type transport system involved in multi-copper enzyme maturation permease subunit
MSSRMGPGPVFVYESLIFARRRQLYAGRMVFVLAVLIGLGSAWWSNLNEPVIGAPIGTRPGVLQALAKTGESFFNALAGIQLTMVLLVAPAATAGALCHDRARGILAQMATTDLSDAEIVLGKLFSRLAPILGLLACALPVVALAALLGGIDGQALVSLFVVSAALAVLGCALALSISVEVAKTHEVIMAVLALMTCWLNSLPIWMGTARTYGFDGPPEWFYKTNPFVVVYAPYSWPGHVGPLDVAIFVFFALAISAGLTAMTIARLRRFVLPAEARQRGRRVRAFARGMPALRDGMATIRNWLARLPGPSLEGNPVLWREWHRNRPSRMARILWGLYWLGAIAGTGIGVYHAITYGMDTPAGGFVLFTSLVLQSSLGLMLLSAQAPTSLVEERVRGSLDAVMTTPLSTRSIVWGKWLGAYRVVLWLVLLPGLAATIVAFTFPDVPPGYTAGWDPSRMQALGLVDRLLTPTMVVGELLSYGAAITSLGLFLATWTPRPGRAVGINVAALVLLSAGWLFLFGEFIQPTLRTWLYLRYNIVGVEYIWIDHGLIALSPMAAPIVTLTALQNPWAHRWLFWLITFGWCLLAWAFAGVMYWRVLKTFDRRLGRMRETSQGAAAAEAAFPAPVARVRERDRIAPLGRTGGCDLGMMADVGRSV